MWPRKLRLRARHPILLWRRGSLRRQLLLLLVPALAAMMAIDTWLTYGTLRDAANTAYDRSLYGSIRAIDNAIGMAGDSVQLSLPDAAMEMFETAAQTHVYYRVSLERVGAIETVTGYDDLPLPKGALASNQPRFYDDDDYRGEAVRIAAMARPVYRPDARMRVIIQVAESSEPRTALIGKVWRSALARDLLLIVLSAAILVGGVTYVLRPLARVRDDVEARSPDDLTPLAFSRVPIEVSPLVDAVNLHVARSEAMAQAQAQFIADAAHQLRTPLAILKTQAEFAQRQLCANGDDPASRQAAGEAVGGIVTQLEQAARLTNQLLALARVRQHHGEAVAQAVASADSVDIFDAVTVAEQVALDYLPLARGKQQDFGWEPTPGLKLPVRADAALLREALANLVHNAIQYSPRGSRITLSAQRIDQTACLMVEDDGPGIPVNEREKVFARFYRRVGNTEPGSGLGLAISREMAARFGGTVELTEGSQGQGVRALLKLPVSEQGV